MPPRMLPRCSDHEFDQIFRFGCTWSSFRRIHAPMRCLRTVLPCQLQTFQKFPDLSNVPQFLSPKYCHLPICQNSLAPHPLYDDVWCVPYMYTFCISELKPPKSAYQHPISYACSIYELPTPWLSELLATPASLHITLPWPGHHRETGTNDGCGVLSISNSKTSGQCFISPGS